MCSHAEGLRKAVAPWKGTEALDAFAVAYCERGVFALYGSCRLQNVKGAGEGQHAVPWKTWRKGVLRPSA